jgi:TPR repeat protein
MPSKHKNKSKCKSNATKMTAIESAKVKLSEHQFELENLPRQCESPLWAEIRAKCGLTLAEASALQNFVVAQSAASPPTLQPRSSLRSPVATPEVLTSPQLVSTRVVGQASEPATLGLPAVVEPAVVRSDADDTHITPSMRRLRRRLAHAADVTVLVSLLGINPETQCFFNVLPQFEPSSRTEITRSLVECIVQENRDFIGSIAVKPDVDVEYLLAVRLFTLQEPIPFFSYVNDILNSETHEGIVQIAPFVRILIKALHALEAAGYGAEAQAYRGVKIADNPALLHQHANYKSEFAPGSLLTFNAFTSVSLLDTATEQFGDSLFYQFLKIRGVNISALSKYPNESELLVMPPGVFRISAAYMLGGRLIVTLSQEELIGADYLASAIESSYSTTDANEQYAFGCKYAVGAGVKRDYFESLLWFEKAASQDHAEAQYRLAECYLNGHGVAKDASIAVKWLHRCADLGHGDAMYRLGRCLAEGGTDGDMHLANYWTMRSAETGNKPAILTMAKGCYFGEEAATDNDVLKWYRLAAELGDSIGQCGLGACYEAGSPVEQNLTEAARLYRLAAEQGCKFGQYRLACCYEHGDGVAQNKKEALQWYRLSADQGYDSAQYRLGESFEDGGNHKEALQWYLRAAEQEHDEAQFIVADWYARGIGCVKCPEEAVKWYRRAAENCHVDAQIALAECYKNGVGVAKNGKQALKWYRKAANNGDIDAQGELAYMYRTGTNVPQDAVKSAQWNRRAADNGCDIAQYEVAMNYLMGTGVTKDPVEAVKWLRRSVDGGNDIAKCILGECYTGGNGLSRNMKEAVKLFREASDTGVARAMNNLARCYANGWGVKKCLDEAAKFYRMAADRDDPAAQYWLFDYYLVDKQNPTEALRWLRSSVALGHPEAQCLLGRYHLSGMLVKEDTAEAFRLLRLAANQNDGLAQFQLGICYGSGTGVAKDTVEEFRLYHLGAANGCRGAQCKLGDCYMKGCGVEQNKKTAVDYYRRAAAKGNLEAKEKLQALGIMV